MKTRKPTIYIAGPMRGYEDGNFPTFGLQMFQQAKLMHCEVTLPRWVQSVGGFQINSVDFIVDQDIDILCKWTN